MNDWARKIRDGNTRALARAASGIENRNPEALELLRELAPGAGRAFILGITGPPGAGKSTLVDALAAALRRRNKTVGIVAVDPSSRISGGAILGDRIRMQQHHSDPGIFVRSMATRGSAGGVARATADLALLMDAAGRDYVIVETVGVGQDEVGIADLAHLTVVVLVPGMGDDVQAIKAGIMEIADVFVINKADLPGVDRIERELYAAIALADGPRPPVVKTVATEARGIDELLEAIGQTSRRVRPAADRTGSLSYVEDVLDVCRSAGVEVGGIDRIALRVRDVGAAAQRLCESGARLVDGPEGSVRVLARGVVFELIQESGI